jgi:putative sigma-54 modulation protein
MKVENTGRNIEYTGLNVEFTARWTNITPKIKKLAETELARIDQMLAGGGGSGIIGAHVILTEDKYRQIAEVTLKTATETLVATCEGTEMLGALHDALRKIEQQAVKHKERRITVERHAKPASSEPLIEVISPSAVAS